MKRIILMLTAALLMSAMLVAGVASPAWANYNNHVQFQNHQNANHSYDVQQQQCNAYKAGQDCSQNPPFIIGPGI